MYLFSFTKKPTAERFCYRYPEPAEQAEALQEPAGWTEAGLSLALRRAALDLGDMPEDYPAA